MVFKPVWDLSRQINQKQDNTSEHVFALGILLRVLSWDGMRCARERERESVIEGKWYLGAQRSGPNQRTIKAWKRAFFELSNKPIFFLIFVRVPDGYHNGAIYANVPFFKYSKLFIIIISMVIIIKNKLKIVSITDCYNSNINKTLTIILQQ